MKRIDHSDNLIHFTKGLNNGYESAYQTFKKILSEMSLKGGNGLILGNHDCICFTEIPNRCLTRDGILNTKYFKRYTPFGFQFTKKRVFELGGRPVIYSLKSEYENIKNNNLLNWRFVTYDPRKEGLLDFTWEREWRIKDKFIKFSSDDVQLVLPNDYWIKRFLEEHEKQYHKTDEDCSDCFCIRNATIITINELLDDECSKLNGTCEIENQFPYLIINMNENNTL